jgi:hypothetical protein
MRALKLLTSVVAWRWTPCLALVSSSLLYVLIVILVTPANLSFGGPPKVSVVNVINAPAPVNAMAPPPPRGASPQPASAPPAPVMAPITASPTPPPAPPPPAAAEPSPAAPPPPPAPAPDDGEVEESPAPPPTPAATAVQPNARFMAAPLRFIPPITPSAAPLPESH